MRGSPGPAAAMPAPAPAPDPNNACPAAGRVLPPDECKRFIDGRVRAGIGAFAPPPTMFVHEHKQIVFAIVVGGDPAQRQQLADLVQASPEAIDVKATEIGRYMRAQLSSDPNIFKVTATSPDFQDIGSSDSIRWTWDIEALAAGSHPLFLTLTKYADPDGKVTVESVPVPPRTIIVKVRGIDKYKSVWEQIQEFLTAPVGALAALVTLLGAIGGAFVAFRKLRRTAEGADEPAAPPPPDPTKPAG